MIRVDQPCTSGNVIPGAHVKLVPEPTRVAVPGACDGSEPTVNLIRDGDAVRAIEVICTCGKRLVLNCVY
jgi:hypothetical protein